MRVDLKHLFQIRSINQASALSIVMVAFLTLFVLLFILYTLHNEYGREIAQIETHYLQIQKDMIQKETRRALKFIAYKDKKEGGSKPLKALQAEVVDAIEQMRNVRDGTGYIFIYTFDGVNVADPVLKQNQGKNLIAVQDPNGKQVIRELINVSRQKEGGFVEYIWNKPLINKPAPKISYAISYAPWKWMIGSGVYLDDVYREIEKKKFEHRHRVSKFIVGILSISTILFLLGMAVYRYFATTITSDISYMQKELAQAGKNYQKLDSKKIRYSEFRAIARYINKMLEELQEKKKALEDLNLNLEKRVVQKTQKLRQAKEFAEEVLQKQDKFIKNAIHEINTPLSIILTNLDLYHLRYEKNRYLTKIEAGIKIIHNIYNDLSYMAKKDYVTYRKEDLDFSHFLQSRVAFFHEIASGNRILFDTQITEGIKLCFNDTQLQRICDNNISNAIKYAAPASTVDIRLYPYQGEFCFEISNRVAEALQDPKKLFERYYRAHDSRGGFGIGLHIVKEICEQNGVRVIVSSEEKRVRFQYFFKADNENIAA